MLETRDVTVFRERSTVRAVESFSGVFAPAQISVLTGDNGSGKTSLALVLAGVLPRIIAGRWSGEIYLDQVTLQQNGWPHGLTAVYASSEPGVDLLLGTVADLLGACDPAIRAVAHRLPLGDRSRAIRRLSAGQRRLLAWLLGAARRPAVLAVDEAFASLDAQTASTLLAGVKELPWMQSTVTIAVAPTSVRESLPHGCGPTVALRKAPLGPVPLQVDLGPVSAWLQPVRRIAFDEGVAAWWRSDPLRKFLIRQLTLGSGSIVRIRGEIGTGKTTILKSIAGFPGIKGDGAVKRLAESAKPTYLGGSMYYVAGYDRIVDFLAAAAGRPAVELIWNVISRKLSPATLETDPAVLSAGQRHLLALTTALASSNSPVLCLDEPERGLDAEARQIVIALAGSRLRTGSCILLATHSESFPSAIADAGATILKEAWVESV